MIINSFKGLTENLKYCVGINQIEVDPEELWGYQSESTIELARLLFRAKRFF
jgi:hypothetical protein